jgi:GDP-4-dehydro-6-deoxy-D-mannose reductase
VAGKKVLITGADGFIGSRLLKYLGWRGHDAHGVDQSNFSLFEFESIDSVIRSQPWEVIIHLAAQSHVPTCEKDPTTAYKTNLNGTAMLVESVLKQRPKTHLVFTSSAQLYLPPHGNELTQEVRFTEERDILPQNLYGRSKWAAELLLRDTAGRYNLKTTILRLFNHTHKAQSPIFFLPSLYSEMIARRQQPRPEIPVGNLDLYRDIGSVEDLLTAFDALLTLPDSSYQFETFNICSGTAKHLRKLAEGLAKRLEIQPRFLTDPDRIRAGEPKSVCGSHEKFSKLTGWAPNSITEEALLERFLAD